MVLRTKARGPRRLVDREGDRTLDGRRRREIFDPPAVRTHQMMVVLGEVFGELVTREFVAGHHAVHDTRFFEHHEVAVHGTLRETRTSREDFGNRERSGGRRKHVDDDFARGRESLALRAQEARHRFAGLAHALSHRREVYGVGSLAMEAAAWARERFVAAVECPASHVRLDVAAFCIAAYMRRDVDVDVQCRRLDELAAACAPSFDGMRAHLFDDLGFAGNTRDYADPENSFLDAVITRRTGIPISLSVLTMEVGRRLGLTIEGVGMPGHFLVHDADRPGVWCDPFHGGVLYDLEGCRALFTRAHGDSHAFHPAFLTVSTPHEILARMLANLEHGRLARDPLQLSWLCELHRAIPGIGPDEERRLDLALRTTRARWN